MKGSDQCGRADRRTVIDQSAPPATDSSGELSAPDQDGSAAGIARSASWSVLSQVAPMGVTVFLTPYVVHGLGVTRYGLFVLIMSLIGFLTTFDGGFSLTSVRFFAVYAGSGDRRATTRLLTTSLLVLGAVGLLVSTAGWLVAPLIASVLRIPAELRPQAVFLFRTLGVLITFVFLRAAFAGILQAHARYALSSKASLGCYALWSIGLVFTVHQGGGLRGVGLVILVQQVFLTLTLVPASLRYVDARHVGLLSRAEACEFLSLAARVQVSSLGYLVNNQLDNLIIGGALSVRAVSFYDTGANFGANLGSIPRAALYPVQTDLARVYGREGEAAAMARYSRFQHLWVVVLTGWFSVAAGCSYFAIVAWLGAQFSAAGWVAVVAVATQMLVLSGAVVTSYCTTVGQARPFLRATGLSVAVNLVATAALLVFGSLGVAVGTFLGQIAFLAWLVHSARRHVSPELPNPLRSVRPVAALLSAALVVALELPLRPVLPSGGLGLLGAALPAVPGLAVYAILALGPHRALSHVRQAAGHVRAGGPRAVVGYVLAEASGAA